MSATLQMRSEITHGPLFLMANEYQFDGPLESILSARVYQMRSPFVTSRRFLLQLTATDIECPVLPQESPRPGKAYAEIERRNTAAVSEDLIWVK